MILNNVEFPFENDNVQFVVNNYGLLTIEAIAMNLQSLRRKTETIVRNGLNN